MKICAVNQISFGRRLRENEIVEYSDVLKRGLEKCSEPNGKNILIVPVTSLPQASESNTGVGNLGSVESLKFFDFAKKYWGINEVQILPIGQYHKFNEHYPVYSGTSMSLGNHVIDIKSFLPEEDLKKIVDANNIKDRVNFSNVVEKDSIQEEMLRKLHRNMDSDMKSEFSEYKRKNKERLEPKAIFEALKKEYRTPNYDKWKDIDKNLYNEEYISKSQREDRIEWIYSKHHKEIDYYKFKQFLAEKSLASAKNKLNKQGLKLNGDLPCGYSYDEVWAHPKAFLKDKTIGWSLPAMDMESKAAQNLFREKVKLYSGWYDGFRVDASWVYVSPTIKDTKNGDIIKKDYGDKFLKIIDEEYKNVKGQNADLKNIIHEFTAGRNDFNIYEGNALKPCVSDRMKYYTSDWLSDNWGSADAFKRQGWGADSFVMGAINHDSEKITVIRTQTKALADILKTDEKRLTDEKEFIKAKFAEPLEAKHKFIFFMPALGINQKYKGNSDEKLNYTYKIPYNYEDFYHSSLQKGEGYNPMDGLEKLFKAKGLDKKDPKLYKKILKYRNILYESEKTGNKYKYILYASVAVCTALLAVAGIKYFNKEKNE